MTTINSGNVVAVPATTIDPNFFLPPGVVDFNYKFRDDGSAGSEDGTTEGSGPTVTDPAGELRPPDWMTVVSQTVHITPTGSFYVDVVIEIENVPGAVKFEARLAKV